MFIKDVYDVDMVAAHAEDIINRYYDMQKQNGIATLAYDADFDDLLVFSDPSLLGDNTHILDVDHVIACSSDHSLTGIGLMLYVQTYYTDILNDRKWYVHMHRRSEGMIEDDKIPAFNVLAGSDPIQLAWLIQELHRERNLLRDRLEAHVQSFDDLLDRIYGPTPTSQKNAEDENDA